MTDTNDFLFELGTEELPPKSLKKLSEALGEGIKAGLEKAALNHSELKLFASPRRLAVVITDLQNQQADQHVEKRGPALKAAFDVDGNPTKACEGFARSNNVSVEQLDKLETEKGTWMVYRFHKTGQSAQALMPTICQQALKNLPIPKPMRWGNFDYEFIRPVRWCIMMLGTDVVPIEILGKSSSNITYGHRVHASDAITIKAPRDYESTLETQAYVIADFSKRKNIIKEQIIKQAELQNATAIIDEALLSEVTGIVEWPRALTASFDDDFLRVPAEALIAAMQDHQKSFALKDVNGKLLSRFIFVSNIESKNQAEVIQGNERVMRARLADAAFFFDADCKRSLESHIPKLKNVTYQKKLGSLYDKSVRVANLAHHIAGFISAPANQAERAGMLSKCDLVTDMVFEFPELQGTMGYYYALNDNEPEAIAIALKEAYLPRFSGDECPETSLGCALALAERIDTLIGIFGINQQPTGVKDPFKCRRQALGIVRIVIEKKLDLDLLQALKHSVETYGDLLINKDVIEQVHAFIVERMRSWYLDRGVSHDSVAAVLERQSNQLYDFEQRVIAVEEFRKLVDAESLAAANKRVSRILIKEGNADLTNGVDSNLLQEAAEQQLAQLIQEKQLVVSPLYAMANYSQALTELADLRPAVDSFFDEVMVNVDDEKIRHNRLALLAKLRGLFLEVADISLLQK